MRLHRVLSFWQLCSSKLAALRSITEHVSGRHRAMLLTTSFFVWRHRFRAQFLMNSALEVFVPQVLLFFHDFFLYFYCKTLFLQKIIRTRRFVALN
jgi:hypothetical protein